MWKGYSVLQPLIDKINAEDEKKRLDRAWFIEHQQIKKAFAPDLWQSLLRQLASEVESINNSTARRLVFDPAGSTASLRNAETGDRLNLQFDPHTPRVSFQTQGPSGYYVFKVNDDGNGIRFLDPKREAVMFPDELVEALLKYVV